MPFETLFDFQGFVITSEVLSLAVSAVSALAATIGLFFQGLSVRLQAKASDFSTCVESTARIENAWRRLKEADKSQKEYEFGELMNRIEVLCNLYNKRAIGRAARRTLRDYLIETLPAIFEKSQARAMIGEQITSPKTYSEIRTFARKHKLTSVLANWPSTAS